ncbi:MAG: TolC family protein [Prevotella sp.]|nr:TolC family protein [Prevotella sp.]
MKKVFSFIVGLACCGSAAAQQTYTLDQLKQLAVENNFNLRSARNAIQQSKELKNEAFTKYFPTVSAVGAGVTMNKYLLEADLSLPDGLANLLPAGVSAAWPTNIAFMKNGVFGSVSAIQPVFMGGQIVNGNKLAKAGVEASEIKLEASEDQVELTTEQYYWQMVSIKEKLHTLGTIHQMLEELEKDVNNKVRVGAVNRNDLLQVQLRKGEVESAQLEAENGLTTVSQLLAQHVGKTNEVIDVSVPAELSNMGKADTPVLPASLRQDHLSALNATPEYRLLEKNVEVQRLQHKMKVGHNLPKAGVGASYSWNNFFVDNGRGSGMLFAAVQIPISGWWGGSHAVKKQKLALDDAREQLEDNSQKLVIRMNSAWAAVETSHKKLVIAHSAIAQAEENLRLNKDYYRVGTTKMSDLLLAEQQYQAACDRYTDAYATMQTKILEYRQATGQK